MAPAPHHSLSLLCPGQRCTDVLLPSNTTAPSMPPAQKQVLLVWWVTIQVGPHSAWLICLLLHTQGRMPANCSPAVKGVTLFNGKITALPAMC